MKYLSLDRIYLCSFLPLVMGRQCYFCDEDSSECDEHNYGEHIHCQTEDSNAPHYGSDCAVGHTGKYKNLYSVAAIQCLI